MKIVWRIIPFIALIITICNLVILSTRYIQPEQKPIDYPWSIGDNPLLYPSSCKQVTEIYQMEYWQCNGGAKDWFVTAWLEMDWDRSLIAVTYFVRHNTINLGQISYEFGPYKIIGKHSWKWLQFENGVMVRLWNVDPPITLFDEVLSIRFEAE